MTVLSDSDEKQVVTSKKKICSNLKSRKCGKESFLIKRELQLH